MSASPSQLAALLVLALATSSAFAQGGEPDTVPGADAGTDLELDELFGDDESLDDDLFSDAEEAPETEGDTAAESPPLDDAKSPSGPATAREEVEGLADTTLQEGPDAPEDEGLASEAASDAPSAGIEEILVHGQTTTGVEVDATVSVTSFGADDLEALGVSDISDVAPYTPNLEIRTASATAATFFIRGVGLNDFTANAAGAIAIYQDDVPLDLPAIQIAQLFDVGGLEILRGPQGSGPNRNASGGSIRIQSQKPTGEFAANLRAEFGRFNGRDFEGALALPLLSDVLSTRLAFRVTQRDPIMRNRCGNAPPVGLERVSNPNIRPQPGVCGETQERIQIQNPNRPPPNFLISNLRTGIAEELNDMDRWAARAQVRLLPPGLDMEWLLNVHGGRLEESPAVGQPIGTVGFAGGTTGFFGGRTASSYRPAEVTQQEQDLYEKLGGGPIEDPVIRNRAQLELGRKLAQKLDRKPFTGDYNREGHEKQTTAGGFLRGDFELGFGRLASISGFEFYNRNRNLDADYTSDNIFEFLIDDDAWQFTQDLQLQGELETLPVRWDAGVYYLMGVLNYDQKTVPSPVITDVTQIYEQKTWSFGPYLGFAWDFIDDFTFEGGFRYNFERKALDIDLIRQGFHVCEDTVDLDTGRVVPARDCKDAQIWDAPTGFLSLRYHISDEVAVYTKYSRGWKAGQYSAGGASGATFTVAAPESLDAFEVGLSGAWFDGRLTAQASLFHYNYDNYQVFLAANNANSPPQRIVTNADDAVVYGAELETVLEPLDGLKYTSRFGWIESEFLDFTQEVFRSISQGPLRPPLILPVTIEWTGNRLPNTPRFKWSGTFEYTWELGRYGQLIPRWDYVWTDDVSFDASDGRGAPNIENVIFMPKHAIGQKAHWLHNLRLVYRTPSGTIEVAMWVRNLTNEVYKTLAFDASVGAGLVGNQVGDPRTFGGTLSFTW